MRVFLKAVRMNLRVFLTRRRGFLISIVIFPLIMVLNVYLFTSIYNHNGTPRILDYDLTQMIWYYAVTMFVYVFTYNMTDRRMSNYILSGELGTLLLRPMPLIRFELAHAVSLRIAGILLEFVPVMCVYSLLCPPTFLTLLSFGQFLSIIVPAFILQFLINFMIGMSAFVTQTNTGMARIVGAMLSLLGGAMIPLDYLPAWLREICGYLPFQYIFYEPVRFFIRHGDTSAGAWLHVLLIQAVWIVILYAMVRVLWAVLLRRTVVAGG